jgi:hypothetical protein
MYHDLQGALQSPAFMKHGGILGFYCNHAYPHSNDKLRRELPMALKGVDLLTYVVCRSLGLQAKARPILYLEDDNGGYGGCNDSDDDHRGRTSAIDAYNKNRKRLLDFQNDGFHVPRYSKRHKKYKRYQARSFDRQKAEPVENKREESPDPIQREFRNMTDDPAKHPLAQHNLTLRYRNNYSGGYDRDTPYSLGDAAANQKYLESNLQAEGVVPPREGPTVRVGTGFHKVKIPT